MINLHNIFIILVTNKQIIKKKEIDIIIPQKIYITLNKQHSMLGTMII